MTEIRAIHSACLVAALALAAGLCGSCRRDRSNGTGTGSGRLCRPSAVRVSCDEKSQAETRAFIERQKGRYLSAMRKAASYLDSLDVDPVALIGKGIKGIKKLAEILDAYYSLYCRAPAGWKERLKKSFSRAAEKARRPEYHMMDRVDDRTFKQNSTSYLRVAFLMEKMKLDTSEYRKKIRSILPRLNAQMPKRGPHQQFVFGIYYRQFGLKEPFPLHRSFSTGYIARRADPYQMKHMDGYHLTHEVFAVYQYGERLDAAYFTKEDMEYLAHALNVLATFYIKTNNADLTAELLSCIRYINLTGMPVFRDGLSYLLKVQNANGSWGKYKRQRQRYGDDVEIRVVLHTTLVAIEALTSAFSGPKHVATGKKAGNIGKDTDRKARDTGTDKKAHDMGSRTNLPRSRKSGEVPSDQATKNTSSPMWVNARP